MEDGSFEDWKGSLTWEMYKNEFVFLILIVQESQPPFQSHPNFHDCPKMPPRVCVHTVDSTVAVAADSLIQSVLENGKVGQFGKKVWKSTPPKFHSLPLSFSLSLPVSLPLSLSLSSHGSAFSPINQGKIETDKCLLVRKVSESFFCSPLRFLSFLPQICVLCFCVCLWEGWTCSLRYVVLCQFRLVSNQLLIARLD